MMIVACFFNSPLLTETESLWYYIQTILYTEYCRTLEVGQISKEYDVCHLTILIKNHSSISKSLVLFVLKGLTNISSSH